MKNYKKAEDEAAKEYDGRNYKLAKYFNERIIGK